MKVTLWRDDVEILRPVRAAAEHHDVRSRLFLRLEYASVHGYGEVAPQSNALNGDASIDEVQDELETYALHQLDDVVRREGTFPSWTRITRFSGSRTASTFAVALVEMAVLDRELRAIDADVRALWPARYATPVMSTVSLLEDQSPWVIDAAAKRVRVKSAPGSLAVTDLERLSALAVPILLDFNCSAQTPEEVLDQVRQVARVATVAAVEQPFAAGNVVAHALLAERLGVALSMDEGVRSTRDLEQIERCRAASMVCIKPARVGGLANARTMIERARELGLRPYLGGFFESPFARAVHRILAEHCVEEPSDLALVALAGRESADEARSVVDGLGWEPTPALLDGARVIWAQG
jgi:O-succinylbenzoate synthase